jgi:hypothetical protein
MISIFLFINYFSFLLIFKKFLVSDINKKKLMLKKNINILNKHFKYIF